MILLALIRKAGTRFRLPGVLLTAWIAGVFAGAGDASAQVVRAHLNVSGGTDPEVESEPSIATLGKSVSAVWHRQHGVANLRMAVSRDGGITWADSTLQPKPTERFEGLASTCIDDAGTAFCAVYGTDSFAGRSIFIFAGSFTDATWLWRRRPNAVPFTPFGDEDSPDGVRIFCDRGSGNLYLVFTRRPQLYEGRIQFLRSTDSGASWSAPVELSGSSRCNTAQLALGPEGELYVVWEDYVQGVIVGRKSVDQGLSFGPPFTLGVIRDNEGFGPPGWTAGFSHAGMLPNMPCMDFPAFLGVAVDTSRGPNRGSIYGVWTEYALGMVNPDPVRTVVETEPNDDLLSATPVAIGDDFAGVFSGDPEHDSDLDVFTFEGTAGTTIQITGRGIDCSPVLGCRDIPMGIWLQCGDDPAQVTYVGCSQVYGPSPIPPMIYTLPTTGRYYLIGVTTSYRLSLREYVVDPGSVARDHRDVVLVRSTDGGTTWSDKVRVNDDAPMYDNAIPAVTVDGSGRVHVAWYDRREEPECGARVHTYWTYSEDGGVTFQPSRRVSQQPSEGGRRYDGPGQENTWQVGDHLALRADGDLVYLLWTQIPIGGGDGEILGVVIGDPPVASVVSAVAQPTRVRIVWQVDGVGSFTVYRREEGGEWTPLAQRAPDDANQIVFADTSVVQGTRYAYRLGVVVDWQEVFLGEVVVTVPREPGGINLSWDDCGAAGSGLKSFTCDSNTGPAFTVVASFVPPPGIGQFTGANAELLIGTDSATLPDWWQHGSGLCRGTTGFAVAYTFTEGPFTCTEAGGGLAVGMHSYEVGYGGADRARLQVQYVVPEEQVTALDPSTEYYAFKVNLLRSKSTGVGACAGCEEPTCLQLGSIQLFQTPGAQYDPVLITPLDRNFVSWQGPAGTCDVATPVLGSLVSAEAGTDEVRVVWEVQAPDVAVYRREGEGDWVLRARLTPDGVGRVAYLDRDVVPGARYGYRLGVSVEGREVYVGETEISVPLVELAIRSMRRASDGQVALLMLSFEHGSPASVEIYDVAGRLWGSRKLEGHSPGRHEVSVPGRQRLSPGVYFVRLAQGTKSATERFPLP